MSRTGSNRRSSWFSNLSGWLGGKRARAPRGSHASRRLGIESLERRSLLSATVLPSISGTSFYDVKQDGLTADDLRLPGVTVSLFRDNGNGQFNGAGGGDQLVGTTTTDPAGKYRFDQLSAGTYFVQQSAAPGFVLPTGQDVSKITVTGNDLLGVGGTVIDSFATTQWVGGSLRAGKSASSSIAASDALGGYRDMFVQLTSSRGSISLGANADIPGFLDFASASASNGMYWVTWDGAGGDPQVLNPTGLGQLDLTSQGASTGFKLTLGADHDNSFVQLKVYSSANNWSWANIAIPNTEDGTATEEVFVPFSSFITGGGSGANFASVGSMRLEINGINAVDGQVGPITAAGPKVFTQDYANVARTDLAIVKTHAPQPGVAGGQLTYTLTSTNLGPSKATGVVVSDTLPAGVTYVSATSSQGNVTFANGKLTVNLGNLSSGATTTTTVLVTISAGAQGAITNTATITGNESDPNLANNTSTTTTQVNTEVDLAITKTDSPDPVVAGRQLTYTLTTTNNGPSNATGVTITDVLPAGVVYVSSTSSQGQVHVANGTLTVNLGSLAPGASATTTVIVTVAAGTTGTIVNTATVAADQTDVNMANNSATANTAVRPEIDLAIAKSGSPGTVVAGKQIKYTLTTTNNGPSNATGVTITDTLPAGVTFASAGGQGTATAASGVITVNLGNLATGETATTTIVVTVSPTSTGTLTNTAEVRGNEAETNLANNKATATTKIDIPIIPEGDPEIDLSIQKTATPNPVNLGANLTYTLLVSNLTPNKNASGVIVTDTLPPGVTLVSLSASQGSTAASNGVVTVNLGRINASRSATVTIVVRVDSAPLSTLTNTARVRGAEDDPYMANNTSTVVTSVNLTPPLTKRRFLGR